MRNENQILRELIEWGESNSQIRALILFGSRANPNAFIDLFSDYDVFVVVEDAIEFGRADSWRKKFGNIIASYEEKPVLDENGCVFAYPKLTLYEDGVRIDFCICNVKGFKEEPKDYLDIGYKVLIDKDNLTSNLIEPTHSHFNISKPSEEDYHNQIQEFWWDIVYVAKSLWRDELYFSKFMSENIIRFNYMQKMIEWYIASKHNWQINTNKKGRWFKRYIDSETWSEIEETYAGADLDENWDALFNMAQLFRKISIAVGKNLGFEYLYDLDERVSSYLIKIKELNKDAESF